MKRFYFVFTMVVFVATCAWSMQLNPERYVEWMQDAETEIALHHWELQVFNPASGEYQTILIIPRPEGSPAPNDTYGARYTLPLGNFPVWTSVSKDFVMVAVHEDGRRSKPSTSVTVNFEVEPGNPHINSIGE